MIIKPMGANEDNRIDTYEILYLSTSGGSLIRWIKKKPEFINVKKEYDNPMVDELGIYFEYKGYDFRIDTPFVDYWVQSESEDCPDEVFLEVIKYLEKKKVNRIVQWFVDREYKRRQKACKKSNANRE